MAEAGVSVVVAAWPDATGLAPCLASLATQRDEAAEVWVVCPLPRPPDVEARFPWVSWLEAPAGRLVPHLWGLGIARARGELVALTTAHFTPAADWLAVIRRSHRRLASPAIGGPIDPPRGGSLVDWATYFGRYSAYLNGEREEEVGDLAGDNASYKRAVLDAHPEFLREGFWEHEFHRRLRPEGGRLTFLPEMRVRQHASSGFLAFVRQRLRHGRAFGASRARTRGPAFRILAAVASPLIPPLLLGRIALRVLRSRRDLGPFLPALPLLCVFVVAWAAGEATGYLAPGRGKGPPVSGGARPT